MKYLKRFKPKVLFIVNFKKLLNENMGGEKNKIINAMGQITHQSSC
jgi:hypothetical protein